MKIINQLSFISITLSLIMTSCSTSQSTYSKGVKLEEEGMLAEASNYYYYALQKNDKNVDASIRLKNVSEIILDDKFVNFQSAINEGNDKRAIHEFISAEQFRDKLKSVNVNLRIPEEQYYYFTEIKGNYVNNEIDKAYKLISDKKYIEAKALIDDVKNIDPWNQEIRDLEGFVRAQPVYEEANDLYEKGDFKNAYYKFDKVLNYKNSKELKSLAKDKATCYLVIRSIKNTSDYYDLDEKIRLNLEQQLLKNEDPFLNILEGDKFKRLISEKELSEINTWSDNANVLLKTDVVVDVILSDVHISSGKLREKKIKGWQYFKRRMEDEEGKEYYKDSYKKIYYYEYSREKVVDVSLVFQLRDFETNKIVTSKVFTKREIDKVNYLEFDGDPKTLRSGYWNSFKDQSANDKIDLTQSSIRDLRRMLSSRKSIKTTESLENEVISSLSYEIVKEILDYSYDQNKTK